MTSGQPTFRFAPSPNGELHIGHALSALTGWQWAQLLGGRFILRIEDIDTGRAREHFVRQIFDDLAWLGISWEEPVRRQSEHFGDYGAAARRLDELGLLYPCFATRKELAEAVADRSGHARDPDGAPIYPGMHKGMARAEVVQRQTAGEAYALRLDMEKALRLAGRMTGSEPITYTALEASGAAATVAARPECWGDAIIVRKDVPASYHLAVVVDDARQGVTHVTRGTDLEAATDLHRLLQVLLGLPAPLYHHHRLLAGPDGRKLSKSDGATSLRSLREAGASAADVKAMVAAAERTRD